MATTYPAVTLDLYGTVLELDSLWLRDRCDSIADDPKRPGDAMVRLLGMHMAVEWMTTLGAVSDADDALTVSVGSATWSLLQADTYRFVLGARGVFDANAKLVTFLLTEPDRSP